MKRLRAISRMPECGQSVPVEVKIQFISDVLELSVPLFQNKDPENPDPDGGTDTGTTTT